MFTTDFYITEIKHYPAGEHSVNYIDNNYEQRILDGNPMEFIDSIEMLEIPDTFSALNLTGPFNLYSTGYPTPMQNNLFFDINGINSSFFILPQTYPYPIKWETGFNGNNVFSTFQILDSYCYSGFYYPENFDVNGIYTAFILGNNFSEYPNTYLMNFPKPDLLKDWHRLDPPYLNELTIAARDNENEQSNTIIPIVKDRDIYREEYIEYYKNYWRIKSQN